MSVQASDLVTYGSANIPEQDGTTSGGAIDETKRPLDQQLGNADTVDVVSDGTDSRDVTIKGRDTSGDIVTETLTLNGTTTVSGTQTFQRILNITIATSDANRTVTVSDGDGGDGTLHTFNPGETFAFIQFQQASSESSQTTRYEKVFIKNETGDGVSLTSAQVTLTGDPAGNVKLAVEDAVDDNGSVADRKTAPTGITADGFVDDGVAVDVPGGSVADGSAIGVWLELTLAAGQSALESTYTVELSGETT